MFNQMHRQRQNPKWDLKPKASYNHSKFIKKGNKMIKTITEKIIHMDYSMIQSK